MQMSDPNSVSALFDQGLQLYNDLCATMEPSNSTDYQVRRYIQVVFLSPTKNCPCQVLKINFL
jgi:hypothetical protein